MDSRIQGDSTYGYNLPRTINEPGDALRGLFYGALIVLPFWLAAIVWVAFL